LVKATDSLLKGIKGLSSLDYDQQQISFEKLLDFFCEE
jgi:hypothetical protein